MAMPSLQGRLRTLAGGQRAAAEHAAGEMLQEHICHSWRYEGCSSAPVHRLEQQGTGLEVTKKGTTCMEVRAALRPCLQARDGPSSKRRRCSSEAWPDISCVGGQNRVSLSH